MKNKYMLLVLIIFTILFQPGTQPVVSGNQCIVKAVLTYKIMDDGEVTVVYPYNKTIKANGLTIPITFNETMIKEAVKTQQVEVIKDLGCCIVRYKRVQLITIKINNTLLDLYYNRTTHILLIASRGDQDLIVLIKSNITTKTCTASKTTTTTRSSTTTTTTTTTAKSSTTTSRAKPIDTTIITILILASTLVIAYLALRRIRGK